MNPTKTNINLIVNGSKVYTRKTTGRPYTHALVTETNGQWKIVSCSSKGTAALQRTIDDARSTLDWYDNALRTNPTGAYMQSWINTRDTLAATVYRILPIVENTVTVTSEAASAAA